MNFIPLYDKIVVLKIEKNNKIGSIFIPINENNIFFGKIVNVGKGRINNNGNITPLLVKINDKILFKDNYNIEKYKIDNNEYFFMKETDIISIIE